MSFRSLPHWMFLAMSLAYSCVTICAQPLPVSLRETLRAHLKASDQQIRQLESGGVLSYLVETGNPEDIMLVGAARIWATPAYFIQQYRNVSKFESGAGVLACAKFGTPPKESDMAGLVFTKDEIDDLRACKPGNCSFKIGQRGMKFLQDNVDWSAPDYVSHANQTIRTMWIEYLKSYQSEGNKVLGRYQDTDRIFSVQKGLEELVSKSAYLHAIAPDIEKYLEDFPKFKLPGSEEFYYWQVGEFGLKPVHRVTHVTIFKGQAQYGEAYAITSKMLWASHYFRSALELRFLIPGQDQAKGGMLYFVVVQRSYVDGLTGLKGRLIRHTVLNRSRQAMERYMASSKDKVEKGFNKKGG